MGSLTGSTDQSCEGNEEASEASEGELRPDNMFQNNEPLQEENSAENVWKVDLTKGMQFFTLGKSDAVRKGRKATSGAFRSASESSEGAPSKRPGTENGAEPGEQAPFISEQSGNAASQDSADSSNLPTSPEGEVESDANRGSPSKRSTPEEKFEPPLSGLRLASCGLTQVSV